VDALLAPNAELDPEFVDRQLARRDLNARRGAKAVKEGYEFYDITAWSLPLSFGVDAYWLEEAGQVSVEPLRFDFDQASDSWRPPAFVPVRTLADLPEPLRAGVEGGVRGGPAHTAYVFRYDRDASARLAIALMSEGFKIAVAGKPMRAGGSSYPRGALVARVSRNPERLHERIAALSRGFGVPVDAVDSGYYEEGPTGVGSNPVVTLSFPRTALLAGEPVGTTSYGHTWYTLEREFGLPFSAVRSTPLLDALDDFDVVIFPSGSTGGYRRVFGEEGSRWASGFDEEVC
jgi:hypothetical protein